VSGGGVAESPGAVSVEFEVSADYPQVTIVSMVAPSPDWFVGVHNLSLLADGNFVSDLSIDLAVYDAGTDSGTRYTSADIETQGREPIGLLTSQPEDAPFQEGRPFVGQLVFERL
ncbi:MAG: spondin domain-containing protein, partial [Pseudomonadota bacterium]